jgi:hypothetical protein
MKNGKYISKWGYKWVLFENLSEKWNWYKKRYSTNCFENYYFHLSILIKNIFFFSVGKPKIILLNIVMKETCQIKEGKILEGGIIYCFHFAFPC